MVNKVFVQVRLPAELADSLKDAANSGARSLPAEIIRRLETSVGDHPPGDLYPGWPPASVTRFRSIANVIGLLCSKIELTYGTGAGNERLLSALRVGMLELFDRFGVKDSEPRDAAFFEIIASQLAAEIVLAGKSKFRTPELAAFAEFVKAWAVDARGRIE